MINVYNILSEVFPAFFLAAMWSQYT